MTGSDSTTAGLIAASENPWAESPYEFISLRNPRCVMLAVAYDAALRREKLCLLRTNDLAPAPTGPCGLGPSWTRPGENALSLLPSVRNSALAVKHMSG